MEKEDIAQQRGKSSHNVESLKRKTLRSSVENVVIAQQRGKSNHS